MSEPLYTGDNTEAVNEELDKIINDLPNDSTAEEKHTAIDGVKEIGVSRLREAMAVDTVDSGTNEKIKRLEDSLKVPVKKNINTVEGMGVESENDIQLVGAGLNAGNLDAGVTFNMGKPDTEVVVPGAYNSTIQVDFELEGADYHGEKLSVPIKIVIPVPDKISPSKLRILHYHNSTNIYDEVIIPHIFEQNGKWYASFVVDSFSTFVFGESDEGDRPKITRKLVVNQKLDVSSMFATKYQKYCVISANPKGAATVTAKGVVTAKKEGFARIAGCIKSGSKWVTDENNVIEIMVEKPVISSKTVMLTKPRETYSAAKNLSNITITPTSWISSNKKVADINPSTGMIEAAANGSTKITAVFGYEKNAAKYSFTLKVSVPVMSKKIATLQTGQILKLKLNNTKLPVSWYSADDSVLKVENGTVTALIAGKSYVYAVADGVPYISEITVTAPQIRKDTLSVKVGKTVTVGLNKTKLKNIQWTSSDESIAKVDSKGKVTGVSAGKAIISTTDGMPKGEKLSCEVTVTAK